MTKKWRMLLGMVLLWTALGAAPQHAAARFAPPAEDAVVFRRDQLPLDVETMAELSDRLLALAKAHGGKNAAKRREMAQMLALAAALQPANAPVRDFTTACADGKFDATVSDVETRAASRRLRQALEWLTDDEPNEDANSLAACLADVLAAAEPDHPDSKKHLAKGEQGAWQGWVEPVAAFAPPNKKAAALAEKQTDADDMTKADDPPAADSHSPQKAETAAILLQEAQILTMLWTTETPGAARQLTPVPISMKTGPRPLPEGVGKPENPRSFACVWRNTGPLTGLNPDAQENIREKERHLFREMTAARRAAAESIFGPLPQETQALFSVPPKPAFRADKDGAALSAPVAVLLHSAFSGRQPGAAVIAQVLPDGSLGLPPDAWLRLRALPEKGVNRLILPKSAETLLPSLLALEIPQRFFHTEILLAGNLDELLAIATGAMDSEVREACEAFQEIRSAWAEKPVGPFVNDRSIRTRLEAITRSAPCHASAAMLAIQGANQRPIKLPKNLLAWEMINIIRLTDPIASAESAEKMKSADLLSLAETIKGQISAFDRYTDLRDRETLDAATELMVALRTFGRAMKKTTDHEGKPVSHSADLRNFTSVHKTATAKLAAHAGQ